MAALGATRSLPARSGECPFTIQFAEVRAHRIVFRCCFLWVDFHCGEKSGADCRERIADKRGIFTEAYASGLVFPTPRENINRVWHQFNPVFEEQSAPSRIIERRANRRLPCLLAY